MSDYENRFRDPEFLTIWQRWQDARSDWRKAWWFSPCPTDPYDPVPENIAETWVYPRGRERVTVRSVAQEFLDARIAYKAKLAEYPQEPV